MEYYVIYSVDTNENACMSSHLSYLSEYFGKDKLIQTEDNSSYDYDYLEGAWENGKHRKFAGLLSSKDLKGFLDDTGLCFEDCETMGSLTLEFGHIPAFSFRGDNYDTIEGAYITPMIPNNAGMSYDEFLELPELSQKRVQDKINKHHDRNWDRFKNAFKSLY